MKNIYKNQIIESAPVWQRFLSILAMVVFLIAGTSFNGISQTSVNGTNVCFPSSTIISLTYADLDNYYHLLRTTDGINYTYVTYVNGQNGSINFASQTVVGKYKVWKYTTEPVNKNPGTIIDYGQEQSGEVYIYAIPTPTINGAATVCSGSVVTYTTQSVDAYGNNFTNYTWSVTGGTLTSGGTATDNTATITWGTAGAGQVSVNYSTPGNVCSAALPTVLPVTIEPVPVFSGVTLNYSMTEGGTAYAAGGSSPNFVMNIHPDKDYYYLDINTWSSTPDINAEFMNPMYLDQTSLPANWLSFWAGKGVDDAGDPGWGIIKGTQPIFYVYKTSGGDYQLIDGFQYQYGSTKKPLRVDGNYPLHNYKYTGTVVSGAAGCESSTVIINMDFQPGVINWTKQLMYSAIQPAIDNADSGDEIRIPAGEYVQTSRLTINKSITLNGAGIGQTIITRGTDWSPATGDLGIAHLVGIGADNVTVSNLTVTGAQKVGSANGSGVNVYEATGVVFTNVESKNNQAAGFIINGSTATMTGVQTSGNGWYAVNVARGSGVTQMPAITVDASTSFGEAVEIMADANIPESNLNYGFKYVFVGNEIAYNIKAFNLSTITYATIVRGNVTYIYLSIQAAINAANTGETVSASAGTFAENIVANKSVVLKGANADKACGSRVLETVIAPASGLPFSVTADGVTINGFEITTASSVSRAIVSSGISDLVVTYNNIHDVGSAVSGENVYGLIYSLGSATATNVTVNYNCFNNIGNYNNHQKSNGAIGFLDSNASGTLSTLKIENNSISNVFAKTADWITLGGRIAYGIQINVGGSSSFLTTGKVVSASIKNNNISNLTGFIATGIALEGNTENAMVEANTVANLTGYKLANRASGGYDLNGLKFENNRYVSTVTVQNNSFQTNTFNYGTTSNLGYAVANYVPVANGGIAQLGCNWYGTANYGELVAEYANFTGKIFSKAGAGTDFVNYSTVASPINCLGVNATPANLSLSYDHAAENVVVNFEVANNSSAIYWIPGLNPAIPADYATIAAKYVALNTALAGSDPVAIKTAALEIGDDIITEYYYMDGTNKVYLQTAVGNPLAKSKYYDGYLNNISSGLKYPSLTENRFIVPVGSYSTSTNPNTQGGTVAKGWLAPVYGKDLYVTVTFLHNGEVSKATTSILIPAAPVVNITKGLGFLTIQSAISNAATTNGDIIEASPGTYYEAVTINKSIHLRGKAGELNNTIIMPPAGLPASSSELSSIIIISGAGVSAEISELTIKGPGPTGCG